MEPFLWTPLKSSHPRHFIWLWMHLRMFVCNQNPEMQKPLVATVQELCKTLVVRLCTTPSGSKTRHYISTVAHRASLSQHCTTMERFKNAAHCDQQPNYTLPHLPEVYWKLPNNRYQWWSQRYLEGSTVWHRLTWHINITNGLVPVFKWEYWYCKHDIDWGTWCVNSDLGS